jgi:hypothetical protein
MAYLFLILGLFFIAFSQPMATFQTKANREVLPLDWPSWTVQVARWAYVAFGIFWLALSASTFVCGSG